MPFLPNGFIHFWIIKLILQYILLIMLLQSITASAGPSIIHGRNNNNSSICPCLNGGKCTKNGNEPSRCVCPPGFRGSLCEKCVPNSRCKGFCLKRPGECACPEGKGGQLCEKGRRAKRFGLLHTTSIVPKRWDLSEQCGRNYTCQCLAGFNGPNCEHRLTHCGEEPCQNEAKCIQKLNGFHCECPEKGGIFGRFCQVRAPRGCQGENPCQNGGSCSNHDQLAFLNSMSFLDQKLDVQQGNSNAFVPTDGLALFVTSQLELVRPMQIPAKMYASSKCHFRRMRQRWLQFPSSLQSSSSFFAHDILALLLAMIALLAVLSLLCIVIQQRRPKNEGCQKMDGRWHPPPPPSQPPPIAIVSSKSNGTLKRQQQHNAKEKELEDYGQQLYVAEPMEIAFLDESTEGNIYYSLY